MISSRVILFSPDVVAFRRQLTRRDSGRRADEFGADQVEQQDESLKWGAALIGDEFVLNYSQRYAVIRLSMIRKEQSIFF